jgi:ankyrin repeat protein
MNSTTFTLDSVRARINSGENVNVKDRHGKTMLHEATSKGFIELTRFLVDKGADVNATESDGNTPLHFAVAENSGLGIVQLLVEKGAWVDVKNNRGKTPLHFAARFGLTGIATFLLVHGENVVEAKDCIGYTPMQYAVGNQHLETAKVLAGFGANVDTMDDDGWTPLHHAARFGDIGMVEFLVEQGAPIDVKSNNGQTPRKVAESKNHTTVVKYLEEKIYESAFRAALMLLMLISPSATRTSPASVTYTHPGIFIDTATAWQRSVRIAREMGIGTDPNQPNVKVFITPGANTQLEPTTEVTITLL